MESKGFVDGSASVCSLAGVWPKECEGAGEGGRMRLMQSDKQSTDDDDAIFIT